LVTSTRNVVPQPRQRRADVDQAQGTGFSFRQRVTEQPQLGDQDHVDVGAVVPAASQVHGVLGSAGTPLRVAVRRE